MRGKLKHLPQPVARTILSFYHRTRLYELLRALLAPLLCYAVLALLATHLDRFLFLDTPDRLLISGWTHGICLLAGVLSLGLFAWRQRPVSRLVYELERKLPKAAAERLVTLDDILARETGDAGTSDSVRADLVAQLTQETVTLCRETPHAGRLVRDRRLTLRFVLLVLLALCWAGLLAAPAYQFPLMLERLTFPGRNLPKPSFMRLTVTPESAVIGRGGEVFIHVQVTGAIPPLLQRPMRWLGVDTSRCLLASATGKVTRLSFGPESRSMSRLPGRVFVASRGDLQESFSYRVRCGDAQTDIRLVRVIAQPRILHAQVLVDAPAYTGLKTARFDDLRDAIPAFRDSHVTLNFASDQSPLKSAWLVSLRDGTPIHELKPDGTTGYYRFETNLTSSVEMEIVIVNALDFKNVEHVPFSLVLREDQAPTARIEYPGGEISAMLGELVPMQMELADDLGLQEGEICYQVNAAQNPNATIGRIPLPVEEKALSQSLAASLDLNKVAELVPGDEVLFWVRVSDTGRNEAQSQYVRLHVTAFTGDENERRRIEALHIMGKILAILEPSATDRQALVLPDEAYAAIVSDAHEKKGLELNRQAVPESLLEFVECEHFFTDSAEAAMELLQLRGVIAGLLRPPAAAAADAGAQRAALRRLADETLPAIIRERMGRDLIRRVFILRFEIQAITGTAELPQRKFRAAQDRRVDLLMEALGNTGDDLAALARRSPQLLSLDEVKKLAGQIYRTGRDLKMADPARQQAVGKVLCEHLDGWIGLLLQPLPDWNTQRRAARASLRAQYDDLRQRMGAGQQKAGQHAPSAAITGWLAANARMVERSSFAGLGERLSTMPSAAMDARTTSATQAALACEAAVLNRMAIGNDVAQWLDSSRLMPAERRVALALRAFDLAENGAARATAAEALRALTNEVAIPADPPSFRGLYAQLPLLSDAATDQTESYEKTINALCKQTDDLMELLARFGSPTDAEGFQNLNALIGQIESALCQWERDAQHLVFRMHLDLSYGDLRRVESARLARALPTLRGVLAQYQASMLSLLNGLRGRLQKSAKAENVSVVASEVKDVADRVGSLGSKLKLAGKQLRGEAGEKELENAVVREMRLCCLAARQLAETNNTAAVAGAFFAGNPAAAAMVLDFRMALLRDLREQIRVAREALHDTSSATGAVYRGALQRAWQCVSDFEQQLMRFALLDADGAVRTTATDVRKRIAALTQPGRDTVRDLMAMDDLKGKAAKLENQAGEVIAKYRPPTPRGWRGGPAGVWNDARRRDAEHASQRSIAQFERARRDIILGLDAALAQRDRNITLYADEPLASAIFAWRTLHASLGNGSTSLPKPPEEDTKHLMLEKWLQDQLDVMAKVLKQNATGPRTIYQDPSTRWLDTAKGVLRY